MAAYATPRPELAGGSSRHEGDRIGPLTFDHAAGSSLFDALIDQLAERVAERLAAVTSRSHAREQGDTDEWLDSRHAAEYLGVHRDTLRKLAAERAIQSEQDGPNCKLYFRRSDLDSWRRTGGLAESCRASRRCPS
jgi:excisionase family DNA binding protein